MGPRADLDRCGKSRPLTEIRSPDRPALSQSLYQLRYPVHLLDGRPRKLGSFPGSDKGFIST